MSCDTHSSAKKEVGFLKSCDDADADAEDAENEL